MNGIHILLVEDNEGDILLVKEALEEQKINATLDVVKNGREALGFIFKKEGYRDTPPPDLILLDVNLPVLNGHEVLQSIKAGQNTRNIPVIMLTTSDSVEDVRKSGENQAAGYIVKPADMESFMQAILQIKKIWRQLAKLPSNKPA